MLRLVPPPEPENDVAAPETGWIAAQLEAIVAYARSEPKFIAEAIGSSDNNKREALVMEMLRSADKRKDCTELVITRVSGLERVALCAGTYVAACPMNDGYWTLTTPCKDCPFRTDVRPYLRKDRIDEFEASLHRGTFTCHKTTVEDPDGEEGELIDGPKALHCAGALIVMEKTGRSSQMMRIAERLGFYDQTKLNMDAPVFEDFESMREAQHD
jgi:hypothetical protein